MIHFQKNKKLIYIFVFFFFFLIPRFYFMILSFVPFDVHVLRDYNFMVPVLFYMLSADCWLSLTATNASLAMLFTSKNNYMARIIRESERGRRRGGVGRKGRVLRDRMSRKICQIHCFFTEALTPCIITPGKPRN